MKTTKLLGTAGLLALSAAGAWAQASETNFTFNVGQTIPDGSPVGLTLATNLTIGAGAVISSLTVSLDITGGFNGDLYACLVGPAGGYAVLLNRAGVGGGSAFGYGNAGFQVTFDDTASSSIHYYQSAPGGYSINGNGQLTGVWQPDGEAVDPLSSPAAFDGQPRTALLSSFSGTSPNGTWTLFLADLSSGGQSTLEDWRLNLMVAPEPSAPALTVLGLAGAGVLLRRRK